MGFTGSAVRNRLKALTEQNIAADGVTISITRPGGTDPADQVVDLIPMTQDPTDPNVPADAPQTFYKVRGDTTLDLAVDDRFTVDGVGFRVVQPPVPDDGRQYKKTALAQTVKGR